MSASSSSALFASGGGDGGRGGGGGGGVGGGDGVLVLVATQSFTAESLVEDVLLERLDSSGISADVRFVDEVFDPAAESERARGLAAADSGAAEEAAAAESGIGPPGARAGTAAPSSSAAASTAPAPTASPPGKLGRRPPLDRWPPAIRSSPHRPLLFVVSTYGDGDPPNHAAGFADWLRTERERAEAEAEAAEAAAGGGIPATPPPPPTAPSLPRYAVFGLGDRAYARYAAFGSYVDSSLEVIGASRLIPLGTGDASGGDQAGEFGRWCDGAVGALGGDPPLGPESADRAGGGGGRRRERAAVASAAVARYPFPAGGGAEWRRSAIRGDGVFARVGGAEELMRDGAGTAAAARGSSPAASGSRSAVRVTLSVPPGRSVPSDLRPGDHVGVYPRNDPAAVVRALDWLGVDGRAPTKILEPGRGGWTPRDLSARDFLSEHVDLAGRATPAVLRALLPFAGTLGLRALARDLTNVDTRAGGVTDMETDGEEEGRAPSPFDEWVGGRRLTALDLAVLFECRPSLQALARACGPLQPRLYSVADVARDGETGATDVGICVAVAEGGLCSGYLAALGRGRATSGLRGGDREGGGGGGGGGGGDGSDGVRVFFRPSAFRFAPDGRPALLVAAGSGVGTCLGFVEGELERTAAAAAAAATATAPATAAAAPPLSHLRLFFGCRSPSEMLYGDRLSALAGPDLGLRLHPAYSRAPGLPRTYAQDLIREHASEVWGDVFRDRGSVYVCGRLELMDGVRAALVDVAERAGGLDGAAAEGAVREVESEGRFRTDCWSVEGPGAGPPAATTTTSHHRPRRVVLKLERHHDDAPPTDTGIPPAVDTSGVPAWPSYLRLLASGELERRARRAEDMFSACVACGRYCEVDRLSPKREDWGECRVGNRPIVASAFPHFGEESCLVGENGSGTIFFGACNLKCVYCQNWDISAMDQGELFDDERLARTMLRLQGMGCHNINFVSPTHNVAPILRAVLLAAKGGLRLPLVWNTGGYDSVASLRLLEGVVDIYMPDAKYASRAVGRKLSKVDNYPEINQAAIKEMQRQVGELKVDPGTGLARRGVLVRHLVLPEGLAGTCDVFAFLAKEVSEDTFANVMDQYRPEHHAVRDRKFGIGRRPTREEMKKAHGQAKCAGLRRFDGEEGSLDW